MPVAFARHPQTFYLLLWPPQFKPASIRGVFHQECCSYIYIQKSTDIIINPLNQFSSSNPLQMMLHDAMYSLNI